MYLTANDNTEILLRTINDLDQLVEAKTLSAEAAWAVIAKTSLHHPEHPKKQEEKQQDRRRAVEGAVGVQLEETPI